MPAENRAVDVCNNMLESANRLPTMEEMWQAGYDAAEEKFKSTNNARDETVRNPLKCSDCESSYSVTGNICKHTDCGPDSNWIHFKRTASPVA
jgi:hypothetical protein